MPTAEEVENWVARIAQEGATGRSLGRRNLPVTADDIRKIALSFENVREVDHWERPAFRTPRRMFAVIRPDGLWLHLPEERKEFLFAAEPKTFVKYMWGRHPELLLQAERVSKTELTALLREAYEHALPEKTERDRPRLSRKRKA
jgi:hypothetical protein